MYFLNDHLKCFEICSSQFLDPQNQCLGSGFGSVGSARFWLPGSGSAKIQGANLNQKRQKKIYSQNPNLNY